MSDQRGAAAEAIQAAEVALARQNSAAAQVDLQVVIAILNAHSARSDGVGDLARLQSDVESAVVTRTDLDTPAGARSFQRYLLSLLRDIRAVVETAELDATSKAALSAALASLYANATPGKEPVQSRLDSDPAEPLSNLGIPDEPVSDAPTAAPAAAETPASPAAMTTPAVNTPLGSVPSWGGAPAAGSALPTTGGFGDIGALADRLGDRPERPELRGESDRRDGDGAPDGETDPADRPQPATVIVGAVIAAAVAGTPIPEAFAQQGITLPPVGSPVIAPIDPAHLIAGDVGVFPDRYALALGNGKALLDNRITPIADITAAGLLGWVHPFQHEQPAAGGEPTTAAPAPAAPAPAAPAPAEPTA